MDAEHDEPTERVYSLVYASAATADLSESECEEILDAARRHNRPAGITGMLVYHEGSFLQVLEGDEAVVEALFERIERDPRHTDAVVLFRGTVDGREFGRWSMGYVRTSPTTAPKGLSEFLRRGFRDGRAQDGGVARKLLTEFREGRWRRQVDTGEAD